VSLARLGCTPIEVDLMAAVRVCRTFIPLMQKSGWGRVILVTSEDAVQPYTDEMPYCAAKAGLLNFAKNLSKAYAKDGVLVNSVSPACNRPRKLNNT
jgi:3-oxoacyl-[acyl-carrier protein] reductase